LALPPDGIYLLVEAGEIGHGGDRIVRVGSHRASAQLPWRLREHFFTENKDRSIFWKNIGRALLRRAGDPFLSQWDLDLNSRAARTRYTGVVDVERQRDLERDVSDYIHRNIAFVVIGERDVQRRLALEGRLATTVAHCGCCHASPGWLGLHSPKEMIRATGLWQVNGLNGQSIDEHDLECIERNIVR
jgi:hypothetical protein